MPVGQLFFGFTGRINRGRYWAATAVHVLAVVVCYGILTFAVVDVVVSAGMGSVEATLGALTRLGPVSIVLGIIALVSVFSQLAVIVKRLHDREKSGWWAVLFWALPLASLAIGYLLSDQGMAGAASSYLAFGLALWGIVELGVLPGTPGPNRFGGDPLSGDGGSGRRAKDRVIKTAWDDVGGDAPLPAEYVDRLRAMTAAMPARPAPVAAVPSYTPGAAAARTFGRRPARP